MSEPSNYNAMSVGFLQRYKDCSDCLTTSLCAFSSSVCVCVCVLLCPVLLSKQVVILNLILHECAMAFTDILLYRNSYSCKVYGSRSMRSYVCVSEFTKWEHADWADVGAQTRGAEWVSSAVDSSKGAEWSVRRGESVPVLLCVSSAKLRVV